MTHTTRVPCESGCGRARMSTNEGDLAATGWRCTTCRRALPTDHPEHLPTPPRLTAAERRQRQAEAVAAWDAAHASCPCWRCQDDRGERLPGPDLACELPSRRRPRDLAVAS